MAKTKKLKIKKRKSIISNMKKHNLKQCFVKLEKIDHLINIRKTNQITLKVNFKKNKCLVNNTEIKSKSRIFNVAVRIRQNIISIENIEAKPKPKQHVNKPLNMMLSDAWRLCKRDNINNERYAGQFVMAKMNGYSLQKFYLLPRIKRALMYYFSVKDLMVQSKL